MWDWNLKKKDTKKKILQVKKTLFSSYYFLFCLFPLFIKKKLSMSGSSSNFKNSQQDISSLSIISGKKTKA